MGELSSISQYTLSSFSATIPASLLIFTALSYKMFVDVDPKNPVEKAIDVMFDMPHEPSAANKAEVTYCKFSEIFCSAITGLCA